MRGREARRWAIVAVMVLAGAGMFRVASVEGQPAGVQSARPTSVAIVDVGRVLEALDEKAVEVQRLGAFGQKLADQVQEIQKQLDAANSDLDVLPKNTPQYEDKQNEAIRLQMKLQGEKEFAKFRLNKEKQRTKLELFNKIVSAAGIYAEREGYDIVLNDDRDMTIPSEQLGQLTDPQFESFVQGRRLIYAKDAVDITDAVATMMNNQFKAGGGNAGNAGGGAGQSGGAKDQ